MKRIKIAGFGGQGIILSAYIVGKAVSVFDGKSASMTQAYGPEARGGACSSQLVVEDNEVHYPLVDTADVLIAMSQEGYDKFLNILRDGGKLVYDSSLVNPNKDHSKYKEFMIPATKIAEEMGKKIVANIVMLGFATKVAEIASAEGMRKAVMESVPGKFVELNLKAFKRGYEYANQKTKVSKGSK